MLSSFTSADLRTFMQHTLEYWHVPGASVAVIKDGEIVLCESVGLRNLVQNLPITSDTLFPIASCTKAFTAFCLGLLVDEGKLDWDIPIHHYLPDFRLQDPYASELLTTRDILCHRSGLPAHDSMWYETSFTRWDIFQRLRYIESSYSVRSKWQYQNMLYIVAGILIEKLTGVSWENFVRQQVFEPLGMQRSKISTFEAQEDPNHSRPYIFKNGELKEIPYLESGKDFAVSSAGAINSCISDLIKWLSVHLNHGKTGEKSIISTETLAEMHKPHIFIDSPYARPNGIEFCSYGLGWSLQSYKGKVMIWHDGETQGFTSLVSLLPRQNMGVIILSNGDSFHNSAPYALAYTIYDRFLNLEPTNWDMHYQQARDAMSAALNEHQLLEEHTRSKPNRPIEDYLGDYEHPGYGIYSVCKDGDRLVMLRNKTVMPLEYDRDDVFNVTYELYDMHGKVNFSNNPDGSISGFSVILEPAVKALFFAHMKRN